MRKHVAMIIYWSLYDIPLPSLFIVGIYIYVCIYMYLFSTFNETGKKHGADHGGPNKSSPSIYMNTSNLFVKLHALFAQSYNPIFKTHPKAITTSMLDKTIGSAPLPFHPHRNLTKHCFVLIYPVLGWGFGVRVGFPFLIGKSVCEEKTNWWLLPSIPIHHQRW